MVKKDFAKKRLLFLNKLENSKVPLHYFIISFCFVFFLRSFLEIFSTKMGAFSIPTFLHYNLFYISLVISLIILIHLLTKNSFEKITKVILPFATVVVIPPIVDLLLTGGNGLEIAYIFPVNFLDWVTRFFTFFGDFNTGITIGIRVELIIVFIFIFYYFLLKKMSVRKSILSILAVYFLFFFYLTVPFFYFFKDSYGLDNVLNLLVIWYYMFLIFIQGVIILTIKFKKTVRAVIKDIRPFRLVHFELMFVFGLFLAGNSIFEYPLEITALFFAIIFAWIFSVMYNNFSDREIDHISNKHRPLQNKVNEKEYFLLMALAGAFAIVFSLLVNFISFFLVVLFIGNYFIYSAPPLRLKRIPLFSKGLIAVNSLALTCLGFSLISGTFYDFPFELFLFILIGFTFVINFIDIKDYLADKKHKIYTLPVLLGLKNSKKLISIFFVLLYVWAFFILNKPFLLLPTILLIVLQIYSLIRKNYNEKLVFLVYLISLILFMFFYLN